MTAKGSILASQIAEIAIGLLAWKPPVRVLADSNQTLSGLPTIDEVVTAEGDSVLLTAQTNGANNGPWIIQANGWVRRDDFDIGDEAIVGATWRVDEGDHAGEIWYLSGPTGPITLNTTVLELSQQAGGAGGIDSAHVFFARIAKFGSTSTTGLGAIDGVTPVAGDLILVASGSAVANGLWVAASGAWTRDPDFAAAPCGTSVYIEEGTDWAGTQWRITTANPFVVGTDAFRLGLVPATIAGALSLPAHSGEVRLSRGGGVFFRDFNETGDGRLIDVDGTTNNIARVGHDTLVGGIQSRVKTGGFFTHSENGVELWRLGKAGANNYFKSTGLAFFEATTSMALQATNGIITIDCQGSAPQIYLETSGSPRLILEPGGVAIGTTAGSYGGGVGVLFVKNAAANPSGNPTGGFVMYADSGACKIRGSGGTITTAGPAEPHCPVCGSDFTTEHESPLYGYLAVCLKCLADELGERAWIRRSRP